VSIPVAQATVPVSVALKVFRDAAYVARVELFEDEAQTKPFSLSGWTVELVVSSLGTLTVGHGLVIKSENIVEVNLMAAQTVLWPVGKYHYALWLEQSGTRLPALNGTLAVVNV
jgi:hypothetical protein